MGPKFDDRRRGNRCAQICVKIFQGYADRQSLNASARSALRFLPYGKFENAAEIPWVDLSENVEDRFAGVVGLGGKYEGRRTCRTQCTHRASS